MKTVKKRQPVAEDGAEMVSADELESAGELEPLRSGECRKHLRATVAGAFRLIVAGFVEQAKSGSCQHLKMALEVLEPKKRAPSRQKGPAELMLEEFDRELMTVEGNVVAAEPG